ncbi:MAG TPA: tRNA-dihydrouridine synthase family protein [Kiritimatiellia bacterium]|nr:tRNA-dihydrouridine synthase family protein [Kiritimatiellia bacterium]HPK36991.1 tRNA-dihydrouridine synthase family protein [Kiritimatiellia bacterium]
MPSLPIFSLSDRSVPPLILAPMAGFTGAPMRALCRAHGAELTYTEMTSAAGLLHSSDKTWHLLETFADEGPVVAHLYGSEPEILAEAAARVEATGRFAAIDLNAGCPVRKIAATGAGATLAADPQRVHAILKAMRRAVTLPLTVKTRLGPDPGRVTVFELLAAAEEAEADAFALHARFTSQGHGGEARLDLLAEVKRRARIPVIGNGGVGSPYTAQRMLQETGVDAVMVARAAIGNPWLFSDIRDALVSGRTPSPVETARGRPRRALETIRSVLEAHLEAECELARRCCEREGRAGSVRDLDAAGVAAFRGHLFRYLHGLKGSSYLRGRLHTLHTLEEVRAAVEACLAREAAYRAGARPSGNSNRVTP